MCTFLRDLRLTEGGFTFVFLRFTFLDLLLQIFFYGRVTYQMKGNEEMFMIVVLNYKLIFILVVLHPFC